MQTKAQVLAPCQLVVSIDMFSATGLAKCGAKFGASPPPHRGGGAGWESPGLSLPSGASAPNFAPHLIGAIPPIGEILIQAIWFDITYVYLSYKMQLTWNRELNLEIISPVVLEAHNQGRGGHQSYSNTEEPKFDYTRGRSPWAGGPTGFADTPGEFRGHPQQRIGQLSALSRRYTPR